MPVTDGKTILTIGIPTYKRPDEVDRLLQNIVPQLTPEVEVLIRDDSPDDKTAEVVKKYFPRKSGQITYSHGERLGIDGGELYVIENAKGDYVWTFGDDDEMAPGGIAYVLNLVKRSPDITFVWANYCTTDRGKPIFDLGGSRFFKDGNDVLWTLTNRMSQVSTFIFRKDFVLPVMPLAKQQNGSWWSIMVPVLHAISAPGSRSYFMQGPYVINHHPTAKEMAEIGFHDRGFKVFGVNFYNAYKLFEGKFDRGAVREVLRWNFGSVWRGVLVSYLNGTETTHGKVLEMIKLYWSYPECWVAAPLFLLPKPILSFLYKAYKKVVKRGYRE